MRRGEAWKALREHGRWMRLSERAVFYVLLERSDNADCSIPAYMTPSLAQLADACCCSKSTAVLALNHLEHHGWIQREPTAGGRGRKSSYQLDHGWLCPGSTCSKRSDNRTVSAQKRSDSRTGKRSDSHPQKRRSDTVSDEGNAAGESKKDSPVKLTERSEGNALDRGSGQDWPTSRTYPASWSTWPPGTYGEEANHSRR